MPSFRRTVSALAGLLSVALFSSLPSVGAQTTALPSNCQAIVGDPDLLDYTGVPSPIGLFPAVQFFGYFTTPDSLPPIHQFVFTYSVPDQSDAINEGLVLPIPNDIKFALYLNDAKDPSNPVNDITLVAESQTQTIQPIAGIQNFTARTTSQLGTITLQPKTQYLLAIFNTYDFVQYNNMAGKLQENISFSFFDPIQAVNGFPSTLPFNNGLLPSQYLSYPLAFDDCSGKVVGDPIFVGFNGQKFLVKGLPDRVYNVLSLPALQLNTRFIELSAGQAMNHTQQASVRQRQSKLIAAMKGAGGGNRLPSTTSWSHDGLYMSETGVQLAGHRLLVQPGAYETGFQSVQLDGAELAVSSEAVQLLDGVSVRRASSSVVEVATAEASFELVNSDHFLNIHTALVHAAATHVDHVDGLLGQTLSPSFKVERTAEFKQHIEEDFLLPAGDDDLWSTDFAYNQYVAPSGANYRSAAHSRV